jgi:hypothetical protein
MEKKDQNILNELATFEPKLLKSIKTMDAKIIQDRRDRRKLKWVLHAINPDALKPPTKK